MTTPQYLLLIVFLAYRKLGRLFGAKGPRKEASPDGEEERSVEDAD